MVNIVTISTNLLEAVAQWTAKTDRAHLSQIVFRDGEVVACDGMRLVRVPLEYDGPAFGIRRTDALLAVAAQDAWVKTDPTARPRRRNERSIAIGIGETLTLGIAGDRPYPTLTVRPADVSAFVTTWQIDEAMKTVSSARLPSPDGIAFDPAFLADIAKVTRAVEPSQRGVRVVSWGGALDPVVFEGEIVDSTNRRTRFCVMPMRT